MKKVLLTLTAVVIFFFTSCKKEAATTTDTTITTPAEYTLTAQNVANIDGVKNLSNQEQKKIAFGLLSPIEKYGAWVENARIASANFTPQQKLLAVELVSFLTPQLFNTGNNNGNNKGQAATFRDNWLKKAKALLTHDQIESLAYKLFGATDAKSDLKINLAAQGIPNCNCNTNSDYGCEGTACHRDDDMQECKNQTSWGCGFCILWACDNTCIILPKIPTD
ncbi:bacteriocin fulvocin C-related protein [Mucilaginibacter mali]|uniref:Bacteriocin fulvocin C-related protein n=1 Tax=Mucilaginibacter mali TaxID=2740462 RepID=A0A7D4Q6B6_9SPHI|nr:bacteriocin fulvocin C-related protein [Mucilaginibacter mali]QKJ29091.1 bacteriocin fulvocin C-related protein [Mucilaginibacter mali]